MPNIRTLDQIAKPGRCALVLPGKSSMTEIRFGKEHKREP